MSEWGEEMNKLFGPNWKTTFSAICSFLMVTGIFISGYLATITNLTSWETKLSTACTFGVGLLKVWIGFLQIDAGTVQALVPGSVTPQAVPSHEIPDNPADKAVAQSGKKTI
jgi:hypothetical protein